MCQILALRPPRYYRTGHLAWVEFYTEQLDIPWAHAVLTDARGRALRVYAFGEAAEDLANTEPGSVITLHGFAREGSGQTPDGAPAGTPRFTAVWVLDQPLHDNPGLADAIALRKEQRETRARTRSQKWPWEQRAS